MMAQDFALLDEKTVLDGLAWRLEQFLDIHPPYGLITPEIVVVARQDMNICGPALDLLVSAVLADGEPPVCELPLVRTDAAGNQRANYTVPLTGKNCPESLRKLLATWAGIVQQLRQLDNQFHVEIARNICDLDPLMNVLSPQVARISADLKKMAEEIGLRRMFLDRFSEALLARLRESEGQTLSIPPIPRTLSTVGEESDSSSNSSRSSRSSRKSRSGPNGKAHHDRSRRRGWAPGTGDAMPETGLSLNGLKSRNSSTSSLRLDPNGVPLEDAAEDDPPLHYSAPRGNHVSASPRGRPAVIGDTQHQKRPHIYDGILPLTIPAFSDDEATSNFASDPHNNLISTQQSSTQPTSNVSPTSASQLSEMLASLRMDTSSPAGQSLYPSRLPAIPPPRTHSPAQSTLPADGASGTWTRGPRPLPPRPSRSPMPEERFPQPATGGVNVAPLPPAAPVAPAAPPPAPINFSFTVPDQGGSQLGYLSDFQVPSQETAVFEIPSQVDIVSSSHHDLNAARQRYAMESTSSLHSLDSDYRDRSRGGDASHHYGARVAAHGRGHMAMPRSTSSAPGTPPIPHLQPNNGAGGSQMQQQRLGGLRNVNSSDPLIPTWAGPTNGTPHVIANGPGTNWVPPNSWHEPPRGTSPEVSSSSKEPNGLFSGMKSWISRQGNSRGESGQPSSSRRSPPRNDLGEAPSPFTPDSALDYYYGRQQSPAGSSRPSSAAPQGQNGVVVSSATNVPHNIPADITMGKPTSPGFAEIYQVNPVAASSYYGASSSGTRHSGAANNNNTYQPMEKSLPLPPAPEPRAADVHQSPEMVAIRETMYGAIADALATPALRQVMSKDSQRAYFSAVSLANLNVSMTLQPASTDTPNLIEMMGREIRLTDLQGAYRTCITELAAIGREATKLSEEDDERAIAYVARGKPLPEPRIGRVRKLLERGVGFVGADGRVRGAKESSGNGTGRSREFSNRISALSVEMMKLPAFQEDMLRILVA